MKLFAFDNEKKEKLIKERNIDLEVIVNMIEAWDFIDIRKVPSRPDQNMFVLLYDWYICCVPFVEDNSKIFLKTAYFSRKMMKIYLK